MSELLNTQNGRNDIHERLLTTVSVLALLTFSIGIEASAAEADADHPTIWIELGGQLEQTGGGQDNFTAPFLSPLPTVFGPAKPFENQRSARYSNGAEGRILFEPAGTDWVFSGALRYGRSNRHVHRHNETALPTPTKVYLGTVPIAVSKFTQPPSVADVVVTNEESHAILDFQAGKDVGLGMLGGKGKSVFSFGVRFAQFSEKQTVAISGVPTHYAWTHISQINRRYRVGLSGNAQRSFRGIGPAIAWDAAAQLASMSENSGLNFDWGVNGALLFGRQKADVSHQSSKTLYKRGPIFGSPRYFNTPINLYHHHPAGSIRIRSVVVPNFGGFAGLSVHYAAAKISFGYRADFFLGAIDGGIDVAKKENRGFYGPFANISIGIGG